MDSHAFRRKKITGAPVITITPEAHRKFRETICKHPPETFALLGGRLDEPFNITEFRFCPPRKNVNGRYDASGVHVNVDHEYMNWVIDNEWVPNGKYMLGIWHSHPAGCNHLSYGDTRTNEGDVVFFSACLDADDSPGQNWRYFIAPITTFSADGQPRTYCWFLEKGRDQPLPASMQVAYETSSDSLPNSLGADEAQVPKQLLKKLIDEMNYYERPQIDYIIRDRSLSDEEKLVLVKADLIKRKKNKPDLKSRQYQWSKQLRST